MLIKLKLIKDKIIIEKIYQKISVSRNVQKYNQNESKIFNFFES